MMALRFLLLALCLPLAVKADEANQKCSLRDETLTMFNTETARVKIPCKYRLADFTCGGYHVKATPSSDWDGAQFTPDKIWVKVTYGGLTWAGRSTKAQVEEASDQNAWTAQHTNTLALTKVDYVNGFARLLMSDNSGNDIFRVKFSPPEIEVRCYAGNRFTSDSYPHSLCGSKDDPTNVIQTRRDRRFPGNSAGSEADDWVIIYDVLKYNDITTNSRCLEVAEKFRENCPTRHDGALKNCGPIFSHDTLAACLVTEDNDLSTFTACVISWCQSSGNQPQPMCPP